MFGHDIAIDLGTATVVVYVKGTWETLGQASVKLNQRVLIVSVDSVA